MQVMTKRSYLKLISASALTLGLSLPAFALDVVETAAAAGKFTTLIKALKDTGLEQDLKGAGPFTVFAPTDEAFAKLPDKQREAILQDKAQLAALLRAHVVSGKLMAAQIKPGAIQSVGGSLEAKAKGDKVAINGANVVQADIVADNGVIHVIDAVIVPKEKM